MQRPVMVIKMGSAVISNENGIVDESVIQRIAAEVAHLKSNYRIVVVSSGAVSSGKSFIKNFKGSLVEKKAAAAVGNPILIRLYAHHFQKHGIAVAQALCERHHFSNRSQFLQLRDTFDEFWRNEILPVVNENDLVSNIELKFSDNDELATLMAVGLDAELMVICTTSGGLLDESNRIISRVERIDAKIMSFIDEQRSEIGLGGMLSKITFTRLATALGIKVVICGLQGGQPIQDAMEGKNGTTFEAKTPNLKARQKWLASGSITFGSIYVDEGAEKALISRKSLLTVGINKTEGGFAAGEVVQLVNPGRKIIGVAKVKLNGSDIEKGRGSKGLVAAHADDIVLFDANT